MSSKEHSLYLRLAAIVAVMSAVSTVSLASFDGCDSANGKSADAVLENLRERQHLFLSNAKFVDFFPSLYFATTTAMIGETKTMNSDDAKLMREQIVIFYEAFEANRLEFESKGLSVVESHWKPYYRNAVRLEKKKGVTAFDLTWLMWDGVDAHLIDLSRSLRFQLREKPESVGRLKVLFFGFDELFPDIVSGFDAVAVAAFEKRKVPSPNFASFNIGSTYITYSRRRSWESAIGNGQLRAKKSQPRLCKE